ncbi:RNA polymerase sigma factor [Micromonospora sp. NPDC093244]|uniref:RNA polymerase sigma factor n=1 Tax=Micromonospora sp. NPDC093244 TaxID=3155071 RepID=UPI003447F728
MTAELTDAVTAAQAGDEEAFRFLYRSLQPGLLRYLTALVGGDAEDVASETWLQISRDLPSFTGGEFRAWTVTIARNRAMDHLRKLRRRPSLPVPVQALADLASDADTAERAGETIGTESALALIATLPPREAEAVLLRAVIGLDAESAGQVLGRRAGAVRTAAHRGLRRLAALLERPDPAVAGTPTVPPPAGGDGAASPVGVDDGVSSVDGGTVAQPPRPRGLSGRTHAESADG